MKNSFTCSSKLIEGSKEIEENLDKNFGMFSPNEIDNNIEIEINDIVNQCYDFYFNLCCQFELIDNYQPIEKELLYSNYKKQLNYSANKVDHYVKIIGDEFNLTILNYLSEKITDNIKQRLDKFFGLSEFKNFKENYEKNFDTKLNESKHNNEYNHASSHSCHQNFCCKCYQKIIKNKKDELETKVSILIKNGKFFIKLREIYNSIIQSSYDLQQIFENSITFLSKGKIPFKIVNIQKQEFTNILKQNYWIKISIQKIYNTLKLNDLLRNEEKDLYYFLSEIAVTSASEMNRFKSLIKEEINRILYLRDSNLDELLSFINQNDKKPKKIKKHRKNKERCLNEDFSSLNCTFDKDVEDFKNFLEVNSISKWNVTKIIPTFSDEWIKTIKL